MRKPKKRNTMKITIPLVLLLLFTQACNQSQDFQSGPTPTPIFLQPEQNQESQSAAQIIESTPSASFTPSLINTPTVTQQPSNTPKVTQLNLPLPAATAISFKPGGTTAYDSRQITSAQEINYVINASKDQTMIIGVSSSNNDVYLAIQGVQSGQTILSSSQQKTDWTGTLPATQEYLITLSTSNPAANYFLNLEIPANIFFAEGTDSMTINGYLDIHQDRYPDIITHVGYLAYAAAGQTMTVNITSPNIDSLSLGIYGQSDGQPYKRYEVKGTSGTLELPTTQGYYIKVYSTGGVSTDFTMEVSIK